jgi:hypothetical protein
MYRHTENKVISYDDFYFFRNKESRIKCNKWLGVICEVYLHLTTNTIL